MTQTEEIQKEIRLCLDAGIPDKQKIYTLVEEKLDVPRSSVRRACIGVRESLERQLRILKTKKTKRLHEI